ncbi:MAG: DMT family transporter [Patescibacteria group bacterium]
MIWHSLLATLSNAGNSLLEKDFLDHNRRRHDLGVLAFLYLIAFLLQVAFLYPKYGLLYAGALDTKVVVLLILMCVLAAIGNGFYYYGLPKEGLSQIQPFIVFNPLLTILLASIFFTDERDVWKIIFACIAIGVLMLTHIRGKKVSLGEGLSSILLSMFLYSFEVLMTKELLYFYSPIALYTIRVGVISLLFFIFFRPEVSILRRQNMLRVVFLPMVWIVTMGATYYSYHEIGIVGTVLVLLLAPFLTIIGSHFLLKEQKIEKKDIIALVLVLLCVIGAQLRQ